jgi:hypothetical protein
MNKNEQIKTLIAESGMLEVYGNPEKYGLTDADIQEYELTLPSPRLGLVNFLKGRMK